MLTEIKRKLEEIDPNVFYGMVDKSVAAKAWDYTVFGRKNLSAAANKTGYTTYYWVAIVREDFVPEGTEISVIDKMLEIDGMRLSSTDGQYEYIMKPNTNTVIEVLTLEFYKADKRAAV